MQWAGNGDILRIGSLKPIYPKMKKCFTVSWKTVMLTRNMVDR